MSHSLKSHLLRTSLFGLLAILHSQGTALAGPEAINDRFKGSVEAVITANMDDWAAVYRDLHTHPELAFQEVRTAGIVAARLKALGYDVTEGVGGTGVVGILKNGDGPVVMIRADMDGLPMEEKTGLPYASRAKAERNGEQTFVMHACGHDAHVAILLATAETLTQIRDQWKGTIMLVAQPAEETLAGAPAMVADGFFDRFGVPDHAFALHVGPSAYGTIDIVRGQMNSYAGGFDIQFNGVGGHGSRPSTTIDPVMMAAKFVVDLQTVVSREKPEQQFGVISVGAIQAGSALNIIPDTARVRGTVRWYETEVGEKLMEGVERTANAIVAMSGAPPADITLYPPGTAVYNDPDLSDATHAALSKVFTSENVRFAAPTTGSEDYGEFVKKVSSSVYFRIGVYDPFLFDEAGKPKDIMQTPGNHSPFFAPVPEPTIETGVLAMTTAVINVLAD